MSTHLLVPGMQVFLLAIVSVWAQDGEIVQKLTGVVAGACERNACVADATYCSEHLEGVYRYLGPACGGKATCSDCTVLDSGAIRCSCETVPFATAAAHGQPCSETKRCSDGDCWQSCENFLFKSTCPAHRCEWNYAKGACKSLTESPVVPNWMAIGGSPASIVSAMTEPMFPLSFTQFKTSADEYVRAKLDVSPETLFLWLDVNMDGKVGYSEFSSFRSIVDLLAKTEETRRLSELIAPLAGSDVAQCLTLTADSPPALVTACAAPELQGSICAADSGKHYCQIAKTCMADCAGCSWLSVEDAAAHRCVPPSVQSCVAVGKFFCESTSEDQPSQTCVKECAECIGATETDVAAGLCRPLWWEGAFDGTCRSSRAVGQRCTSDLDCMTGAHRCEDSVCVANDDDVCETHRDCSIGKYCGGSGIGGAGKCTTQLKDGEQCQSDSECVGTSRCESGVCVRLFSLPTGAEASFNELCNSGQASSGRCVEGFQSLRVGQACESDSDCTTNAYGGIETAACSCTGWWDTDLVACKRCQATTGDLANYAESLRAWLWLKGQLCHSAWSVDECHDDQPSVQAAFFNYQCELQTLAGGVTHVDPDSVCMDTEPSVVDFCKSLRRGNSI